jgi:hypothetical protein
MPLAEELRLPSVRFVFPNAPFGFMGFPTDGPGTRARLAPMKDWSKAVNCCFVFSRIWKKEGIDPGRTVLMDFPRAR